MEIRQNQLGNCCYVVVYYTESRDNWGHHITKKVKRFSSKAIANKGYGYGEYACAEFLRDNPELIDGIKLDTSRTHWVDGREFDWLSVHEL